MRVAITAPFILTDEGETPQGRGQSHLVWLEPQPGPQKVEDGAQPGPGPSVLGPLSNGCLCVSQIVLLKDQRKCFSIDSPGYEPEVVAVHPGGETVAIGGAVRPCPHTLRPGVCGRAGGAVSCVSAGLPQGRRDGGGNQLGCLLPPK